MKLQNVTKLTLAALLAVQVLNLETASAAMPKRFSQVLHTRKKEALQDPYYQIKGMKIRELTEEESLKYINEDEEAPRISNKSFVGPNIPNVPPVPPSNSNGNNNGNNNANNGNSNAASSGNSGNIISGPTGGVTVPTAPVVTQPAGALDNVIMVIDKLIAIGQKIIPTIKQGQAIVTNSPMAAVSVLPRLDGKDPVVHDMGGWTIPVSKHYKITYTNGFGSEVVSFVYSITYQYNGSMDGKGKYLAGIRASARDITISWGFDLDASSQLIQISNVGTQQNVVAGATLEMTYAVKNWTRTIWTSTQFFVSGDGKLYKLD